MTPTTKRDSLTSARCIAATLALFGCASAAPQGGTTPKTELVIDEGTLVQGRSPRSEGGLPLLPQTLSETSVAFQSGYAAAEPLLRAAGPTNPPDDQAGYDAWITATLMPWLDGRGREVEAALRPLGAVTQGPPPERVVAAALVGLLYARMHDQLVAVPPPPSVRADQGLLRIYQDQVHETSAAFVENAVRALRACAVSAAAEHEPIYVPWLELCQGQLGKLQEQEKAAAALHAQLVAEREAAGVTSAAPDANATPEQPAPAATVPTAPPPPAAPAAR